jgi:hypothetical protein
MFAGRRECLHSFDPDCIVAAGVHDATAGVYDRECFDFDEGVTG